MKIYVGIDMAKDKFVYRAMDVPLMSYAGEATGPMLMGDSVNFLLP